MLWNAAGKLRCERGIDAQATGAKRADIDEKSLENG
jgi:hypothetical protein